MSVVFRAAGRRHSPRTRALNRRTTQKRYFTVVDSSSVKTVADRHISLIAAYRNGFNVLWGYREE